VGEDECVVRGQGGEIVRCRDEWLARQRRDSDRHTLTKFWVRIESRATAVPPAANSQSPGRTRSSLVRSASSWAT